MKHTTLQYVLMMALVVAAHPAAQATANKPAEAAPLTPRRVMRKPAHTIVSETDHLTDMITVIVNWG